MQGGDDDRDEIHLERAESDEASVMVNSLQAAAMYCLMVLDLRVVPVIALPWIREMA